MKTNRTDLLDSIKEVVTYFTILGDELILKLDDACGGVLFRGNLSSMSDEELYEIYISFRDIGVIKKP